MGTTESYKKTALRKQQERKIKEFYDEGFSISELAIMYRVSEYRIQTVLEETEDEVQ